MGSRRVTYGLALTGVILFCALYPHWFSLYLFVIVLLLAPFDLAVSLPGMLARRVWLSAPRILRQGDGGVCAAVTYQKNRFPCGRIKAKLSIRGEGFALRRKIYCAPVGGSRFELAIDTAFSGVTAFRIKRIHTTSLLGLFSIPVSVNCSAASLILPLPVEPDVPMQLPRGTVKRPKITGDLSEGSDLRPYRQGDPIKLMHWKLSAKRGDPIIREPLSALPHSRFVSVARWRGAGERDLILGRLLWVSDCLLTREMPYYIKLGEGAPAAEITRPEELLEYLYRELNGAPNPPSAPAQPPARFEWVYNVTGEKAGAGS